MFRFAVAALLVLNVAVILDRRAADAAAVSGDLCLSEFCAGYAPPLDDTIKTKSTGQ